MATFNWRGGSGTWGLINASDWAIGGIITQDVPGGGDTAVLPGTAAYTVSVESASVDSLNLADSAARVPGLFSRVTLKLNTPVTSVINGGSSPFSDMAANKWRAPMASSTFPTWAALSQAKATSTRLGWLPRS